MPPASNEPTIRPTLYKDLPQILDICNFYIVNTVATFHTDPQPLSYAVEIYHSVLNQGLPHLVVTAPSNSRDVTAANTDGDGNLDILGYAYATQLHPRPGYAASVEISIYLSLGATRQGLGKKLLTALLDTLKAIPKSERRPWGIREVFAKPAVCKGNDVRGFYLREGFEEVGRLRDVGWKMGMWIDVAILQLSIGERNGDEEGKNSLVEKWWPFGSFAWDVVSRSTLR